MENSSKNSLNVLDIAIKQESDGIKFYTEAASKCNHHLGKAMFQSFVEDEKEHLKRLEKLREAESFDDISRGRETQGAKERLISAFSEIKDKLESVAQPESDDIEALKIAIEIEKKGHNLYDKASKDASDEREKELFKFLAKEEIIHYEVLKNTYNYLDNLDKSHAKEEDRGYDLWVRMINDA